VILPKNKPASLGKKQKSNFKTLPPKSKPGKKIAKTQSKSFWVATGVSKGKYVASDICDSQSAARTSLYSKAKRIRSYRDAKYKTRKEAEAAIRSRR
jgi:hypothetical protein